MCIYTYIPIAIKYMNMSINCINISLKVHKHIYMHIINIQIFSKSRYLMIKIIYFLKVTLVHHTFIVFMTTYFLGNMTQS